MVKDDYLLNNKAIKAKADYETELMLSIMMALVTQQNLKIERLKR